MNEHNADDENEISEIVDLAVKRIAGVTTPAHGGAFLLLKSAGPKQDALRFAPLTGSREGPVRKGKEVAKAGETETPAMGPGEADAIMRAVTGEGVATCAAHTQDGTPCQRPAVAGGRCHLHKAVTVAGPAATKKVKESGMEKVKKTIADPAKALARLEKAAAQLPANHPVRQQASGLVLFHRLRSLHNFGKASVTGDQAAAIAAATADAQAAATSPQTSRSSARDQISAMIGGTQPSESLRGTQNSLALEAYSSPAASLGQALKQGAAQELAAAEEAFRLAKSSGDVLAIQRAGEILTHQRLRAHHLAAQAMISGRS